MSAAIRGNTQDRIRIAAARINAGTARGRAFDNCFEMGDGDEVFSALIHRARHNAQFKSRLLGMYSGEHAMQVLAKIEGAA